MKSINPYLNFKGNTEEAFNFYKEAFGGEFALMRYKDAPEKEKMSMSESDQEKVLHVSLSVGKMNMLMASDVPEAMGELTIGNNFAIYIEAESKEEVDSLFGKLSQGGKVQMPLSDTFWGAYFGMLTDKFGIQWMIGYEYKKE